MFRISTSDSRLSTDVEFKLIPFSLGSCHALSILDGLSLSDPIVGFSRVKGRHGVTVG